MKESLNRGDDLDARLKMATDRMVCCSGKEGRREAVRALMEKRQTTFNGR